MEKFIVSGYARLVLRNYYVIFFREIHPNHNNSSTNFIIQNDSMKKLIEKYAEMENVIPEAIQLIFKGNPVTKDDTPNKLEITSEDILEVCKVPGIFIPAKKPSTPSPADMDESSKLRYN